MKSKHSPPEDMQLPDLEAARPYVVAAARDLLAEEVRTGFADLNHFIEITEEAGRRIDKGC